MEVQVDLQVVGVDFLRTRHHQCQACRAMEVEARVITFSFQQIFLSFTDRNYFCKWGNARMTTIENELADEILLPTDVG